MIYDKKRKFKKSGLMLLTSMFLVSSIIPYFGNMNKVEAFDWKNYMIYFSNGTSTNLLSRTHKKELMKK